MLVGWTVDQYIMRPITSITYSFCFIAAIAEQQCFGLFGWGEILVLGSYNGDVTSTFDFLMMSISSRTFVTILIRIFSAIQQIIAHGDYCDHDSSYVIKKIPFTRDATMLHEFIRGADQTGGGDTPECYEYVLRRVRTDFKWTKGK